MVRSPNPNPSSRRELASTGGPNTSRAATASAAPGQPLAWMEPSSQPMISWYAFEEPALKISRLVTAAASAETAIPARMMLAFDALPPACAIVSVNASAARAPTKAPTGMSSDAPARNAVTAPTVAPEDSPNR